MEIWRDISGFEKKYEVSNTGKVRFSKNKRELNPWLSKGYPRVGLSLGGRKHKFVFVHRLVAETFIPIIPDKPHINHIDGNPENNSHTNLEWCTPKENVHHSLKILKRVGSNSKIVMCSEQGIFYKSAKEAHGSRAYPFGVGNLRLMLNGVINNRTTLIWA